MVYASQSQMNPSATHPMVHVPKLGMGHLVALDDVSECPWTEYVAMARAVQDYELGLAIASCVLDLERLVSRYPFT